MKILFLSYFFCCFAIAGSDSFDLNHDGVIDFEETTENKILVLRKEDLDFDGSFDRQTTFEPLTPDQFFKVIEEKKNGSNPRSRVVFWHDLNIKKSFSLTQIDENNDGVWDKEFQTSTNMDQRKELCEAETTISDLSKTSLEAATLSDEFQLTPWGHKIHKSCLQGDSKKWFLENTKSAIEEGMSCLNKLALAGGIGASKNYASLTNLLKQNNVQIICNEKKYDWSSALAHGSTSAAKTGSSLVHPGISVNPNIDQEFRSKGSAGTLDFKSTIFHEQLHNLGYLHGLDLEYPYTCEKCCFPAKKDSVKLKEAACKVCSGNYDSKDDLAYVRDITFFGREAGRLNEGIESTIKYLKRHKNDLDGISYLALNLSDPFNPIGGQLAAKLRSGKELSPEQLKTISAAEDYNEDKLLKPYEKTSKIIADAYYESYKSHNPKLAIQLLKKNAPLIKAQIALKHRDPNCKYVVEELKAGIEQVVNDVTMNQFYGSIKFEDRNQLTNDAYEVEKIFGIK